MKIRRKFLKNDTQLVHISGVCPGSGSGHTLLQLIGPKWKWTLSLTSSEKQSFLYFKKKFNNLFNWCNREYARNNTDISIHFIFQLQQIKNTKYLVIQLTNISFIKKRHIDRDIQIYRHRCGWSPIDCCPIDPQCLSQTANNSRKKTGCPLVVVFRAFFCMFLATARFLLIVEYSMQRIFFSRKKVSLEDFLKNLAASFCTRINKNC